MLKRTPTDRELCETLARASRKFHTSYRDWRARQLHAPLHERESLRDWIDGNQMIVTKDGQTVAQVLTALRAAMIEKNKPA